jgi:hypothetical protein
MQHGCEQVHQAMLTSQGSADVHVADRRAFLGEHVRESLQIQSITSGWPYNILCCAFECSFVQPALPFSKLRPSLSAQWWTRRTRSNVALREMCLQSLLSTMTRLVQSCACRAHLKYRFQAAQS